MHLRLLLIHLRFLLLTLLDGALMLGPAGRPRPGRIAVIRLDRIGDAVLWLPAAAAMRRARPAPQWRLELITTAGAAALMRSSGLFDAVWPVDPERMRRSPWHRLTTLKWMRQGGWSEVIHPVGSRCISDGDALVRVSGASIRIGACDDHAITPPWLSRWADRWYTRLIPAVGTHELERNQVFVAAWAGMAPDLTPRLDLAQRIPGGVVARGYAVVVPGAHWAGRRWPAVHFAEVARRLHAATGWTIVLAGSASERALSATIAGTLGTIPCIDLTGTDTPLEMTGVIAGAALLVANDSAALHLAAAVGVPAVAIAGGGHVGRFLPYPDGYQGQAAPIAVMHRMPCFGCDWQCIHHPRAGDPMPCIAAVTVDAVWQAVQHALERKGAGSDLDRQRPD